MYFIRSLSLIFLLSLFGNNISAQTNCDIYITKEIDNINKDWLISFIDFVPVSNSDRTQIVGIWAAKYLSDNTSIRLAFTFILGKVCLDKSIKIYFQFSGDKLPEILEFNSVKLVDCDDSYEITIKEAALIEKLKHKKITKIYSTDNKLLLFVNDITASVIMTSFICLTN